MAASVIRVLHIMVKPPKEEKKRRHRGQPIKGMQKKAAAAAATTGSNTNDTLMAAVEMTQSDLSEKYQPQPDGQSQRQYFGNHQSLSTEGHTMTSWNVREETMVFSVSVLSCQTRRGRMVVLQPRNFQDYSAILGMENVESHSFRRFKFEVFYIRPSL